VGENVFGLLNWNGGLVFDEVHSDLEFEGYEVQAVVIPAAAVNAPHGRDRVWFVATNTKHLRCEQCQQQGQSRCGQGLSNGVCDNGIVADFDCISDWGGEKQSSAAHKQGWSGETNSGIGVTREQQFVRDIASEGDATNSECDGLEHGDKARNIRSKETTPCGKGSEPTNDIATNVNGDVTNASIGRIQGHGGRSENGEFQTNEFNTNNRKRQPRMDWEKFPTQSPICGGDDGLPTQLDGITFSKWRNESIKAYGNAIVPQVAYEIFKAIQRTI
jgi:DNA (cytosine-5)-methyltransferase 1